MYLFSMFFLCFFIVFNVFFVVSVNLDVDYCSLCRNHTMCMYKGLGYKCGYTSTGGYLTEDEKKTIVDTHNRLRALVASGGETRGNPGPQPSATDMQELEWDEDLARTAQAWADQCDFGHDACRLDPRFSVGQNVFMSEGGVPWEQAILSWYSEVEFFDHNIVDSFIFDEVTGHYVQMMWGNTRYIGCGKRTYPQKPRRYYKRDTSRAESLDPQTEAELSDNVRQARKIGGYNYYNSYQNDKKIPANRNYDFSSFTRKPPQQTTKNTKHNWNNYEFSTYTQQPKTTQQTYETTHLSQTPTQNYETYNTQNYYSQNQNDVYNQNHQNDPYSYYIDEQWKRYNATIQQYYEKYKNSLKNSDDLKKQLQFYNNYLEQMKQLNSPYLSYEQKSQLYHDLYKKHDLLEKIHQRLIYYDQKLKDKIANTKKLNPYIPKTYGFSTEVPVVSGEVFEYYVCNYGPSGLWPGGRIYTRGWNQCQYNNGLCKDPLTVEYYPSLERGNDPILALLYENKKK